MFPGSLAEVLIATVPREPSGVKKYDANVMQHVMRYVMHREDAA